MESIHVAAIGDASSLYACPASTDRLSPNRPTAAPRHRPHPPPPCPARPSLELGLEKDLAAFCSQECFKGSWTEHKKLHKPSATEGWHYCTRRGQVRGQGPPPPPPPPPPPLLLLPCSC